MRVYSRALLYHQPQDRVAGCWREERGGGIVGVGWDAHYDGPHFLSARTLLLLLLSMALMHLLLRLLSFCMRACYVASPASQAVRALAGVP